MNVILEQCTLNMDKSLAEIMTFVYQTDGICSFFSFFFFFEKEKKTLRPQTNQTPNTLIFSYLFMYTT